MALYIASFYPDTIGNGEYNEQETYSVRGLETGERYSNNKNDLSRRMKKVGRNRVFSSYPVILNINKTALENVPVMRFRLNSKDATWGRIL